MIHRTYLFPPQVAERLKIGRPARTMPGKHMMPRTRP
jgi:hypothetical protein